MAAGTIERAMELARSGQFKSVGDIRRRLKEERFDAVEQHLDGRSIQDQLKRLMNPMPAPR